MKTQTKNLFSMMALLEYIRSKADYHKMVQNEKLRSDCIMVLMTTQPTNYN